MRSDGVWSGDLRALFERVDTYVRDAASVRAHLERVMRREAHRPERRAPRRWSGDPKTVRQHGPAR